MTGFARIVDGEPVQIEMHHPYEADGVKHPPSVFRLWSNEELAAIGILPIVDDETPSGRITGSTLELADGEVLRHWTVASVSVADRKTQMLADLGARRLVAEEAGTNRLGSPMGTDRVTQVKLTGAYVKASADDTYSVRWKVAPGLFVTLDAATIINIGDAVAAYVQDCFDREDELTTAILAASTHEGLDAININSGWPS